MEKVIQRQVYWENKWISRSWSLFSSLVRFKLVIHALWYSSSLATHCPQTLTYVVYAHFASNVLPNSYACSLCLPPSPRFTGLPRGGGYFCLTLVNTVLLHYCTTVLLYYCTTVISTHRCAVTSAVYSYHPRRSWSCSHFFSLAKNIYSVCVSVLFHLLCSYVNVIWKINIILHLTQTLVRCGSEKKK